MSFISSRMAACLGLANFHAFRRSSSRILACRMALSVLI